MIRQFSSKWPGPSSRTVKTTFTFLDHFRVLLLFLIPFWSILVFFIFGVSVDDQEIRDDRPRWPPPENMT